MIVEFQCSKIHNSFIFVKYFIFLVNFYVKNQHIDLSENNIDRNLTMLFVQAETPQP